MKLVCYGASVTAQKNETGYFQQLTESPCAKYFQSMEKIAFGASQFEYAGYSFMQDVLDKRPDVCLIDWLTPSMPGFNEFKIDLLNYALLEINCLPIWTFFPRVNNFQNAPQSFEQVNESTKKFDLPFLDLRTSMLDFMDDPKKYLRDSVHTTLEGARCYSNRISQTLIEVVPDKLKYIDRAKSSNGFIDTAKKNYSIPLIKKADVTIDSNHAVEIEFEYTGGFFEVYFDTEIGPHICYLNFELYKDGDLFYEQVFNKVDPWCYYNRSMIIETLRKRLPAGNYKLCINKGEGNPFSENVTRKPVEENWEDKDRFISVKRISVTANDYTLSVNGSEQ